MKTKEEIEQLAKEYAKQFEYWSSSSPFIDYIKGYTQCQEDMAKKYTEEDIIKLMSMATKWDTFKDGDIEYGMDMDSFFKYLINSLNKKE